MKRKGLYLILTVIAAGVVSFTTVTGNQTISKQKLQPAAVQVSGNLTVEYNANGSTRQITWHENDAAVYVKTFVYAGNTVGIKEQLNNKTVKEETGQLNNGILVSIQGKLLNNDGTTVASYTMQYQYNDAGQTQRVLYGNGDRHDYVYDNHKNLIETTWYNRRGEIMVTAKKQYFPRLPDAYTVYHHAADNVYVGFIGCFGNTSAAYNKMADKIKNEISFDGAHNYVAELDGYILN